MTIRTGCPGLLSGKRTSNEDTESPETHESRLTRSPQGKPMVDQIRAYWNEHIHDLEIARYPIGTREFFRELTDYRHEKLEYLRQQEAIVSGPAQKFALTKQIEEAEQMIRELGG